MKWIVLAAALFIQATSIQAMTIKADAAQRIELDLSQSTFLTVDKPRYYRGYIRSQDFINKVVAYDAQGNEIKELLNYRTKEMEIFWLVDKAGTYQLEFDVDDRKSSKIELSLTPIPLKDDQYLSPETTMLSPLVTNTAHKIAAGDTKAEDKFWQHVTSSGTPLVEYKQEGTAIVTFLYQGEANNVRILGAPNGGHAQLSHLAGSDIWFHSFEVPDSTRLSYRVAPNVPQLLKDENREQRKAVLATAQLDPLNTRPSFGEDKGLFGSASTLTLANASSDRAALEQGNPKGKIDHYSYQGQADSEPREISVYTPNQSYSLTKDAPLLLLFDGASYINKVPTPLIMDNLIADKRIPPMRVVFINPPRPSMRAKELTPNKAFADMLANELMPWLCSEPSICPTAENTVISGSSFGGLASMHIAILHPNRFGKVLSQSGSFWWEPKGAQSKTNSATNWMSELIASESKKNLQIYLNAGLFETEPKHASILETNQQLFSTLQSKGYNAHLQSVASGHDYFSWRVMLADGLTVLFSD